MNPYKVGDTVWNARCDRLPVSKPCPVCFGTLEATLTLGNGESISLDCDYCGKGFSRPTGTIQEYEYVVKPEPVTITTVNVEITSKGEKHEYRSGCYCYDSDRLFATRKKAEVKGIELKAALDEEQNTRVEYLKTQTKKSFAWNAGYHMREAKRHREQAEYHDGKARLCKLRAKKEG